MLEPELTSPPRGRERSLNGVIPLFGVVPHVWHVRNYPVAQGFPVKPGRAGRGLCLLGGQRRPGREGRPARRPPARERCRRGAAARKGDFTFGREFGGLAWPARPGRARRPRLPPSRRALAGQIPAPEPECHPAAGDSTGKITTCDRSNPQTRGSDAQGWLHFLRLDFQGRARDPVCAASRVWTCHARARVTWQAATGRACNRYCPIMSRSCARVDMAQAVSRSRQAPLCRPGDGVAGQHRLSARQALARGTGNPS
jgi:hypothetical protein